MFPSTVHLGKAVIKIHLWLVISLAGKAYYFACHRWLSRDEDAGLIERDLFPGEAESHDLDVQYTAEVFTSDMTGAGTDADVSLVLFGHLGDSGPQSLDVSCCAVFCHAVPCCAVLCHAMLCYAALFAEGCCLCHPVFDYSWLCPASASNKRVA